MYEPIAAIKIIKCKECGADVRCNANYPITELTCQRCYQAKKDTATK